MDSRHDSELDLFLLLLLAGLTENVRRNFADSDQTNVLDHDKGFYALRHYVCIRFMFYKNIILKHPHFFIILSLCDATKKRIHFYGSKNTFSHIYWSQITVYIYTLNTKNHIRISKNIADLRSPDLGFHSRNPERFSISNESWD